MQRLSFLGYAFVLVVAFVVGLVGTVAASQALVSQSMQKKNVLERHVDTHVEVPSPQVKTVMPTVEC